MTIESKMRRSLKSNRLKQGIRDNRKQVGFWLTLASPSVTEIAAGAGFDWVLIDMEHTSNELPDVVDHLRAATAGGDAEPAVRLPGNDPILVKRLLDLGARSLMFPNVQSAEEARRAVASTRYPPHGIRGFAGSSRATLFGRLGGYADKASDDICVIVQIETVQAVDAIAEIAAVDGVDCIFVGPNDLAASMGFLGKARAPEVRKMVLTALERIRAAGVCAGLLDYDETEAKKMFDAGFGIIAVGGDTATVARGTERIAQAFAAV
jgi:4-hydroxy-2-oxoheptanedioate aldolase